MFWSPLNSYAQLRAAFNGLQWQPSGGVFAVEGTVYPGAPGPVTPITDNDDEGWWGGFASGGLGGLINVADGLWYVESIGYPAATTPMLPSAQIGAHNLGTGVRAFADEYRDAFGVFPAINTIEWSQGTMAGDIWWTTEVLPDGGRCNDLLPYIYRRYCFGQPWRAEGISIGDQRAGLPGPGLMYGKPTAGVGGTKYNLTSAQTLVNAPDGVNVINGFNNHGDLYGAAPNPSTSAGKVEAGFADMIFQGKVSIKALGGDLFKIVGDVEAGYNTLKFFSEGQNAPHFQYWQAMNFVIDDLVKLGNSLPHQLGT